LGDGRVQVSRTKLLIINFEASSQKSSRNCKLLQFDVTIANVVEEARYCMMIGAKDILVDQEGAVKGGKCFIAPPHVVQHKTNAHVGCCSVGMRGSDFGQTYIKVMLIRCQRTIVQPLLIEYGSNAVVAHRSVKVGAQNLEADGEGVLKVVKRLFQKELLVIHGPKAVVCGGGDNVQIAVDGLAQVHGSVEVLKSLFKVTKGEIGVTKGLVA
jgi:hypothetical protein